MNFHFFESMSKRRRGFPSETHVKRGARVVHGHKLLEEKLGQDLYPTLLFEYTDIRSLAE